MYFIDWSNWLTDVLCCAIVDVMWDHGQKLGGVYCQSIHWNGNVLVVFKYLSGISTRLLTTGARFVLVVLHLIVATSGPSAFAAQLISSVVTMLLLKIAQFYLACTKNVFSFPKSQLNPYWTRPFQGLGCHRLDWRLVVLHLSPTIMLIWLAWYFYHILGCQNCICWITTQKDQTL